MTSTVLAILGIMLELIVSTLLDKYQVFKKPLKTSIYSNRTVSGLYYSNRVVMYCKRMQ